MKTSKSSLEEPFITFLYLEQIRHILISLILSSFTHNFAIADILDHLAFTPCVCLIGTKIAARPDKLLYFKRYGLHFIKLMIRMLRKVKCAH